MTEKELHRWLRRNGLADLWWVSVAGDVADEPRRLEEVVRIQSSTSDPVNVLHVSQAGSKDPPWVPVEVEVKSKRRGGKRKSHVALLVCGLGVLMLVLVGGAYFVGASGGAAALFSVDRSAVNPTVERDPPLRVRVGRSDWMLFVYNGNLGAWSGMEVQLITGDQVWSYSWPNTLDPEQTLQIPFRDFSSEHGRLDVRSAPPERIRLIVNGYAEFEERMR